MPVENEFNFVLHDPKGRLEARLRSTSGVRRLEMRQGYLGEGVRIRAIHDVAANAVGFVLSVKRKAAGEVVEVEAPMSEEDFRRLWPTCPVVQRKTRYAFEEGGAHWDVDYFRGRKREAYFVKAEAEVAPGVRSAPPAPALIAGHVVAKPGKRTGFSSRRLADEKYARGLLAGILARNAKRDRRAEAPRVGLAA